MFGFSRRGKRKGRGSQSMAWSDVEMKGFMGLLGWWVGFVERERREGRNGRGAY